MDVRIATPSDKDQVLKLMDEMASVVYQNSPYQKPTGNPSEIGGPIYDEIMDRKDTMIFVAEERGAIVGLMTFYLLPNIRHGWHRGHIEDALVQQNWRRKGVGTALLSAIKHYCKQH